MIPYSSPPVVFLRTVLRRLGLTGPIARILDWEGYETRFVRRLKSHVRAGDFVWDVGANVGDYTAIFSSAVGERGKVVAFEPSPASCDAIRTRVEHQPNVVIVPVALSDHAGVGYLACADGPTAPGNRVAASASEKPDHIQIQLLTGDAWASAHPTLFPSVIKIDVEGHEAEVVAGLTHTLMDPRLRVVFMEIHFQLFDAWGRADAPGAIVQRLSDAGFGISWSDASHLVAVRG